MLLLLNNSQMFLVGELLYGSLIRSFVLRLRCLWIEKDAASSLGTKESAVLGAFFQPCLIMQPARTSLWGNGKRISVRNYRLVPIPTIHLRADYEH